MKGNYKNFNDRYFDERPIDDSEDRLFCDLLENENEEDFLKNKEKMRFHEKKRGNSGFFS